MSIVAKWLAVVTKWPTQIVKWLSSTGSRVGRGHAQVQGVGQGGVSAIGQHRVKAGSAQAWGGWRARDWLCTGLGWLVGWSR
jgi:hypothetical protein